MDLGAYVQIEDLDKIAKDNGIDINKDIPEAINDIILKNGNDSAIIVSCSLTTANVEWV